MLIDYYCIAFFNVILIEHVFVCCGKTQQFFLVWAIKQWIHLLFCSIEVLRSWQLWEIYLNVTMNSMSLLLEITHRCNSAVVMQVNTRLYVAAALPFLQSFRRIELILANL